MEKVYEILPDGALIICFYLNTLKVFLFFFEMSLMNQHLIQRILFVFKISSVNFMGFALLPAPGPTKATLVVLLSFFKNSLKCKIIYFYF